METRFWGSHFGQGFPQYISEAPWLHALEIVQWINTKERQLRKWKGLAYYIVEAGGSLTCARMGNWFATGKWYLKSALGGLIAKTICELAPLLQFTLICYSFSTEKPTEEVVWEHLDVGWTVLETTCVRAKKIINDGLLAGSSTRIPRIPLTQDEVKNAIQLRYAVDEAKAIGMLSGQSSTAAEVILRLGLSRDVIRQAIEHFEYSRAQQVVLCTILCTTRFKYYAKEGLLETQCLKCGEIDSFEHLVECAGLVVPPLTKDTEPMVDFLIALTRKAYQINPGLPIPIAQETGRPSEPLEPLDELSLSEFEDAEAIEPDEFSLSEEHFGTSAAVDNGIGDAATG